MKHEEDRQCKFLTRWRCANERRIKELRWLYHVPNGGKRTAITGAILKSMGVRPGFWDYILPVRRGASLGLIIEMKHGKNKLTPEQQEFGDHMLEEGWCTAVCYDWTSAASTIAAYLGHERGF